MTVKVIRPLECPSQIYQLLLDWVDDCEDRLEKATKLPDGTLIAIGEDAMCLSDSTREGFIYGLALGSQILSSFPLIELKETDEETAMVCSEEC